jgi:hypothetical protein
MVSIPDKGARPRRYVLKICLIVWVDVVDLDATRLVVFEILDDLIGISLAPVTRCACGVRYAA